MNQKAFSRILENFELFSGISDRVLDIIEDFDKDERAELLDRIKEYEVDDIEVAGLLAMLKFAIKQADEDDDDAHDDLDDNDQDGEE
jgi:anthranilate phosphoribosyltransferase